MLLRSAQKACQEVTWEFPEREIELVLTRAEQNAGAERRITAAHQFPRTPRHVFHYGSRLRRCLQDARPGRSYYPHAVTHAARRCAALFHLGGLLGLIMDLTDEGHARLSAAASSSYLHRLANMRRWLRRTGTLAWPRSGFRPRSHYHTCRT